MTDAPKLLTEAEALVLWEASFHKDAKSFAAYKDQLRERGLLAQEPVDPLLIEAREIAANAIHENTTQSRWPEHIRSGNGDDTPVVHATLAALRRGMELAERPLTREMVREALFEDCPISGQWSNAVIDSIRNRLNAALTGERSA